MRILIISLCIMLLAGTALASTLDGYDRAKLADENYRLAHGGSEMPEAKNDPGTRRCHEEIYLC